MVEGAVNLVTSALTNVSAIFTEAVTMVTTNAIPMAFIGIALVGGGLGLFRRTIHTR
jgi:hypothetical protein